MNKEDPMRMKCNNCGSPFAHHVAGLVVHTNGTIAVAICPSCTADVAVAKIVVKRVDDQFVYEQFLPAARVKNTG
jgi:hypothetical protein